MALPNTFQPSQILCIEHEEMRLFAEVIQLAEARPLCWVRPLFLAKSLDFSSILGSSAMNQEMAQGRLQDLRESVDLLLPIQLFRPALDTEVIPLLTLLCEPKAELRNENTAHQCLQNFTKSLWRTHPEVFLA